MDRRAFVAAVGLSAVAAIVAGARQLRPDRRTVEDDLGGGTRVHTAPAGGPQSAVNLAPVDGEVISGAVQSNFAGNGFYARHRFTKAADWTGPNPLGGQFRGFDDPNFIPIVTWLTDYGGLPAATAYRRMDDLGLNGMLPASGAIDLEDLVKYGKWAVVTDESHRPNAISAAQDPGVVGVSCGEEPSTRVQYERIRANADRWLASGGGAGRFHLYNFADNLLNGDVVHTYLPKDMVTGWVSSDGSTRTRRQYTACDQYWYAGSGSDDAGGSRSKLHSRLYFDEFTTSGPASTDQTARGCHYGSMLDSVRKRFADPPNRLPGGPIAVWIEAGAPYAEPTSRAMTPAQMAWAVWATFVHGARGIHYFVHNFRTGDSWGAAFWDDHFGGPGVPGTGIYAAAKELNLRALRIAPVINAPFDGYFVYGDTTARGSISKPGFLTAVTSTHGRSKYGGVDASCKWHPTERKHYILATTREEETSTNVPISCRMVDQGQTVAAPVFGGPVIPIRRGGAVPDGFCEFSDTFSHAYDYKCWRIE